MSTPATTSATTPTTRALLACGIAAGPLFLVVTLVQALTRQGFDLTRHVISQLAIGTYGWVQIVNFVVTGGFILAIAVGLRRALSGRPGGRLLPALFGIWGLGLAAAGAFVADPAYGFPPGTPEGRPESVSLHGALHGVAFAVSFTALIVAAFVAARRWWLLGRRGWAIASTITGCALIALIAGGMGAGVTLLVGFATIIAFAWASATFAAVRAGTF